VGGHTRQGGCLKVITSQVMRKLDIPRHKLYYLEQKGLIRPNKVQVGVREFRVYPPEQVRRAAVLWKYLKAGFKYGAADEKARQELGE